MRGPSDVAQTLVSAAPRLFSALFRPGINPQKAPRRVWALQTRVSAPRVGLFLFSSLQPNDPVDFRSSDSRLDRLDSRATMAGRPSSGRSLLPDIRSPATCPNGMRRTPPDRNVRDRSG